MGTNISIYCEFAFLEKFMNACPRSTEEYPHMYYKYWYSYLELFTSQSDCVLIDIGKEEFINRCDESIQGKMYELLLNSFADGREFHCLPEVAESIKTYEKDNQGELYFNAHDQIIFFLDRDQNTCREMEEDYGLIFISLESLYNRAELLFTPQRHHIDENTYYWDFVRKYRHPCNSLLLIDNYILNKDKNIMEQNITSLLDALLPMRLNRRHFKVTIITVIPEKQNKEWADKKKSKLEEFIKDIRDYPIDVSIAYITDNKNHDRNLLTNYYLFDCGYGFVLTGHEREKGTKLTIFPITHSSTLSIMQNLEKIQKVIIE